MNDSPLNVLCVIGTSSAQSATQVVVEQIARRLRSLGAEVDIFSPSREPLALFDPQSSYSAPGFSALKARVERADVFVLGTPDYHGSVSSTLKNFLDHFWQEFTGKLFGEAVCSNDKGLTVIDQLRTVARQCYAWTLPYGLSFAAQLDLKDGKIISAALEERIEMFVHDLVVFGSLLRNQRVLASTDISPGFFAHSRSSGKSKRASGSLPQSVTVPCVTS